YLDAMEAAGFKNLTVDELIAMKIQGVTPEYVREIHELGFEPTPDELVGMRVQGITSEYVREMRAFDSHLNIDELIGMKVQGITPEFIENARKHGFQNLTLDKLTALKHADIL